MKARPSIRLSATYGAVAALTALAATVMAASAPEVRPVETSVDWSTALDGIEWSTPGTEASPAQPVDAPLPLTERPSLIRI